MDNIFAPMDDDRPFFLLTCSLTANFSLGSISCIMILTTAKIKATDFPFDRTPRTEHHGVVYHALLEE